MCVNKPHCAAAVQCGLFTYKSVPVIFEPPCIWKDLTFSHTANTSKCRPNLKSTQENLRVEILSFCHIATHKQNSWQSLQKIAL